MAFYLKANTSDTGSCGALTNLVILLFTFLRCLLTPALSSLGGGEGEDCGRAKRYVSMNAAVCLQCGRGFM